MRGTVFQHYTDDRLNPGLHWWWWSKRYHSILLGFCLVGLKVNNLFLSKNLTRFLQHLTDANELLSREVRNWSSCRDLSDLVCQFLLSKLKLHLGIGTLPSKCNCSAAYTKIAQYADSLMAQIWAVTVPSQWLLSLMPQFDTSLNVQETWILKYKCGTTELSGLKALFLKLRVQLHLCFYGR